MFYCERCGERLKAGTRSAGTNCTRCRSLDGVIAPLRFRLFEPAVLRTAGIKSRPGKPAGWREKSEGPT